jgi:hypothetical protein
MKAYEKVLAVALTIPVFASWIGCSCSKSSLSGDRNGITRYQHDPIGIFSNRVMYVDHRSNPTIEYQDWYKNSYDKPDGKIDKVCTVPMIGIDERKCTAIIDKKADFVIRIEKGDDVVLRDSKEASELQNNFNNAVALFNGGAAR